MGTIFALNYTNEFMRKYGKAHMYPNIQSSRNKFLSTVYSYCGKKRERTCELF